MGFMTRKTQVLRLHTATAVMVRDLKSNSSQSWLLKEFGTLNDYIDSDQGTQQNNITSKSRPFHSSITQPERNNCRTIALSTSATSNTHAGLRLPAHCREDVDHARLTTHLKTIYSKVSIIPFC